VRIIQAKLGIILTPFRAGPVQLLVLRTLYTCEFITIIQLTHFLSAVGFYCYQVAEISAKITSNSYVIICLCSFPGQLFTAFSKEFSISWLIDCIKVLCNCYYYWTGWKTSPGTSHNAPFSSRGHVAWQTCYLQDTCTPDSRPSALKVSLQL
jgi:hypothetical protein